ncbi:MAG: carbohydrate ABC transporter permease [Butyrivibrio sp.]|nr:carbohydrate ABC transporter permease [Butyrivibrio sp.]MBQ4220933.1 carbohydrate ABC transporter permease [Butyrivibrio sp.]MBR4356868.1 carbohydrate ABC transporter permease [Butyrivibrio sp.]MEE3470547.1 carbohydrate ABC transporter permease [Butyrivibrio hungatei]
MDKKKKTSPQNIALTVLLSLVSLVWIYPVFNIVINSLKENRFITTSGVFELPSSESFSGIANYIESINGMDFLRSFWYSLIITVSSVCLIMLCCSMAAWYVVRVDNLFARIFYYLCIFSMVVPFQMVMFTLANTADRLHLNTPYNICVIYLGFGAGLAVFMFSGFVRSIPLEIEEAAMIDGCNPLQIYFHIIIPILKPTIISTAILDTMWVWNDYLLPTLVLDIKKYRTIPMAIQYFRGSFGTVNMGAMMASIVIDIVPIIILYLICQKYIIEGVVAGAVKG